MRLILAACIAMLMLVPATAGAATNAGMLPLPETHNFWTKIGSLSCETSTRCIGLGNAYNSSNQYQNVAWLSEDGGASWALIEAPDPETFVISRSPNPNSTIGELSCPSALVCVVRDSAQSDAVVWITVNGGENWKLFGYDQLPRPFMGGEGWNVSCESSVRCIAQFTASSGVGPGGVYGEKTAGAFITTNAGVSWSRINPSPEILPKPVGAFIDRDPDVNYVNCSSASVCIAKTKNQFEKPSSPFFRVDLAGWISTDSGATWSLLFSGVNFDDGSSATTTQPPVDVCPNLEGVQQTVPSGKVVRDGLCVDHSTGSPTDTPPANDPPVADPPPVVKHPSGVMPPKIPVLSRVVLPVNQRLDAVAKTGLVQVQLPVTESGVKVTQQFTVSAATARQLGLKVPLVKNPKGGKPIYAKTVVIGTGSVVSKGSGVVAVQVRLTAAAKKALAATKIKSIPVSAKITLAKSGKSSTLTKPLTLKR